MNTATPTLSYEQERMRKLQQKRAEAAAERGSERYATCLSESIARRTCGFVSFSRASAVTTSADTPRSHTTRFSSAECVRHVQNVVEAVTRVLQDRSEVFATEDESPRHRLRGHGLALKLSSVSESLLEAFGTPFLAIRLEFPAGAFHPYFELLEEVLAGYGRPTIAISNPRVDANERAFLNGLVEEIRRRAMLPGGATRSEDCRLTPYPSFEVRQRGLQQSGPGARVRLWEAVRKNRNDLRQFLYFLDPCDASYTHLCFTATRADSDAFSAELAGHRWNVNTFSAELKAFDFHRNVFMRQLREALADEPAAEKIRVIGKIEHCLHGGLRLLVIIVLPQTCSATPATLQTMMDGLWRKSARGRSNVALVPLGIDRYAKSTTRSVVSLRHRIIDRVAEVDALVRLDMQWIAENSSVGLSTKIKTISWFAA